MKLSQDIGIGKNIRKLRLLKKLKQVEVVAQMQIMGLNISRVTYVKMEHDNYSVRISELAALKIIFDASFEDFFEGVENQFLKSIRP